MANGETPGIGGVPGLAKLSTRAPKAYNGMAREALIRLPRTLSRSSKLRRRIRKVGGR